MLRRSFYVVAGSRICEMGMSEPLVAWMNPTGDVHNREEAYNSFTWTVRQMSKPHEVDLSVMTHCLFLPIQLLHHLAILGNSRNNQNAPPQFSRGRLLSFSKPKVQARHAHPTPISTPPDSAFRKRSAFMLHPRRAPTHPHIPPSCMLPSHRSCPQCVRA